MHTDPIGSTLLDSLAKPFGRGARSPLGTTRFAPSQAAEARADFASILGIQDRLADADVSEKGAGARRVAEEFVAKVFIEPVLKQARESNKTPPPFGPGQGEKQFASLMDSQRALNLVRSTSWPIVERLASDMERAGVGDISASRESGVDIGRSVATGPRI